MRQKSATQINNILSFYDVNRRVKDVTVIRDDDLNRNFFGTLNLIV